MKKIVIAPQAFKGGLRGMEAAHAMAQGVRRMHSDAELVLLPVADGGDGTLDALVGATNHLFHATVTHPLGYPIDAAWGVMADGMTAVIEMARASGIALVTPEQRDPRVATSYGTGQLIRAALDAGYREIIVGLGGSATNDGGGGMAQALGARLLDARGNDLPFGGAALATLERIELAALDPRLKDCRIHAATDVNNPLCGPEGASATYGPQKGATPTMVQELDAALKHFAAVIKRDVGIDVMSLPRAGAAGGAGAGLHALVGAHVDSGAGIVCDALRLEERIAGADLVIIGEGQLDWQTVYDKAPIAVAQRAQKMGIPVIAIAGSLGPGYGVVFQHGVVVAEAATPPDVPLEEAIARASTLVADATERALRRIESH